MSRRHHEYIPYVAPEPDYFRITNINSTDSNVTLYFCTKTNNSNIDIEVLRNLYSLEISKDENFSTFETATVAESKFYTNSNIWTFNKKLLPGETLYFRNPNSNLHNRDISVPIFPIKLSCANKSFKVEGDITTICGYKVTGSLQIIENAALDITDFNFTKLAEITTNHTNQLFYFSIIKSNRFIEIPGIGCSYICFGASSTAADASFNGDLSNITITTPISIVNMQYMFYNNLVITKSPILKITHTTNLTRTFYGCSNLREITLECRDITLLNDITDFASRVAAEGIFRCPAELEIPEGQKLIPTGWTRVDL